VDVPLLGLVANWATWAEERNVHLDWVDLSADFRLESAEQFRAIYKERRDVVSAALTKIGIKHRIPDASFYMWCNTPEGYKSSEFVTNVLMKTGVVLTPGNGFGTPGEGYFRISLTVNNEKLEEAVSRISKL